MLTASRVRSCLIAVCVSLGLGCGGVSHDRPKVKLSSQTSASFCSEVARVACYNMFECCTGAQIEKLLGIKITTTETDCKRDAELLCEEAYYRQLDSLSRNTVALDVDGATACLGAYVVPKDQCFPYATKIPWAESCANPFFVGLVEVGGDCIDSYECAEDSYCAPDKKCKAYAGEGQSCTIARCASGLRCDGKSGKCVALSRANQPCSYQSDCVKGLYCELSVSTTTGLPSGVCQAQLALGESCASSASCLSSYCIPGLCVGITTMGADKPCYKDLDCGSGRCENSSSSCIDDQDCGGKCSDGYSCYSDSSCSSGKCTFNKCQAAAVCQGQPVCGESHTKIDYCDGTGLLLGSTATQQP